MSKKTHSALPDGSLSILQLGNEVSFAYITKNEDKKISFLKLFEISSVDSLCLTIEGSESKIPLTYWDDNRLTFAKFTPRQIYLKRIEHFLVLGVLDQDMIIDATRHAIESTPGTDEERQEWRRIFFSKLCVTNSDLLN